MKLFHLLLFPLIAIAQQTDGCANNALLYSRELFRGPVTVERAMALSGYDAACKEEGVAPQTLPQFKALQIRPKYQYYPIDSVVQDMDGRDLFLGVVTDALINYLVYDRAR